MHRSLEAWPHALAFRHILMTNSTPAAENGAVAVAMLFGLGRIPRLPGTAGSLAAALLFLAFSRLLPAGSLLWAHLLWLGVLLPVAVWTSAAAVRALGTSDPAPVVIDEALGQHLALLPLALPGAFDWKIWVGGFLLFSAID
ncbi:MAG: phosphatidylglycerophosphatase A, partial [Terriglobia bacterium]